MDRTLVGPQHGERFRSLPLVDTDAPIPPRGCNDALVARAKKNSAPTSSLITPPHAKTARSRRSHCRGRTGMRHGTGWKPS